MGDRLKVIRKELKMTQEVLAGKLGIGKSALSMIETGKAKLSERNKNILIQELNVNPDWMETRRGKLFNAAKDQHSFLFKINNNILPDIIPFYNIDGTPGLEALFNDRNGNFKPVDFIYVPNLPRCDGAIRIVGNCMYPQLKSGDIVLYKRLSDINDIFWGNMYLLSIDIEGEEYVTVQYVQRSERPDHIKLVGQSDNQGDKDIKISRIRAIAIVKASIRMETIR